MTARVLRRSWVLAVLAVALTATSADAEAWGHRDARGDAFHVIYRDDGSAVTTVDRANQSSDITRLVVRHARHAVLVDLHLRDLRPTGDSNAVVRVMTDRTRYQALATYSSDDPGSVRLVRGRHDVACSRMRARFVPQLDSVRLRFPRTCLERPREIRVRAMFRWWDSPGESFYDEALAVRTDDPPPTWSPWLLSSGESVRRHGRRERGRG